MLLLLITVKNDLHTSPASLSSRTSPAYFTIWSAAQCSS